MNDIYLVVFMTFFDAKPGNLAEIRRTITQEKNLTMEECNEKALDYINNFASSKYKWNLRKVACLTEEQLVNLPQVKEADRILRHQEEKQKNNEQNMHDDGHRNRWQSI